MDENRDAGAPPPSPGAGRKARQRARLEAALRDNLRRRKVQARGRGPAASPPEKGQS